MKDVSHLEPLMRWNEAPLSQYEEYLRGIKFARAELGIDDEEVPTTTWEAGVLYRKLLKRTPPVTTEQRIEIARLTRELGAEFTDTEIVSEGQAQVVINYLKKKKRVFFLFGARDEFELESNKMLFKWFFILMFVGLSLSLIPPLRPWIVFIGFSLAIVGLGLTILKIEVLDGVVLFCFAGWPLAIGAMLGIALTY